MIKKPPTSYLHVCRGRGCGHRKQTHDGDTRHCPKCGRKLRSRGLPRPMPSTSFAGRQRRSWLAMAFRWSLHSVSSATPTRGSLRTSTRGWISRTSAQGSTGLPSPNAQRHPLLGLHRASGACALGSANAGAMRPHPLVESFRHEASERTRHDDQCGERPVRARSQSGVARE